MSDDVVSTPFGKFLCGTEDLIESTTRAGTLWDGPGFLQPIAEEYGQLGTRGMTILDVGANIGTFSIWLAYKKAWRVVAFEPVGYTMQRLKANLDLNKEVTAGVVIPIEVAAYDHNTMLAMAKPLDTGNIGGTALVEPVGKIGMFLPARKLDEYSHLWQGGVSLIKIDAQGCDGRAIHGLLKTIQRHHPAIVFEWEADLADAHGYSLEATIRTLTQLDYVVDPWPSQANNFLATWRQR